MHEATEHPRRQGGDGEASPPDMAARIATLDWAATALGPRAQWPAALQHAVAAILPAQAQIVLFWGPDYVALYNDSYAPTIGAKHPAALGRPAAQTWSELWDDLKPLLDQVRETGRSVAAHDRPFLIERHGFPEQVFFNISYSAVPDADGAVGGVLCIVAETTEVVLAQQRHALHHALGEALREGSGPSAIVASAAALIGHHMGVTRCGYGEVETEGDEVFLDIDDGWSDGSVAPLTGRFRLGEYGTALLQAWSAGQGVRLDDVLADPRLDGRTAQAHLAIDGQRATMAVPVTRSGRLAALLFVHQAQPRQWYPAEEALLREAAERIWQAVERTRAEAGLRHLNANLEQRVAERTAALAEANRQLREQIAERERMEATLQQMQRLEAVGQLTAGVAHDFNNLLTVVLGNAAFLEKPLVSAGADARALTRLGYIRTAAQRGAALTTQLLAFSRRQLLEARPLDLNEVVDGMHDLLRSSLGGPVHLQTALAPGLWPAMVDPTQIELAILNLAINGRDAMERGGTLSVSTGNVRLGDPIWPEDPPAGDYVVVAVADTGTGMTPDVLAKAYEPFFTTKPVGRGSGLGLPQVFGFARQSGGGMRIDSHVGRGTTVRIYLPRAAEDGAAAEAPGGSDAVPAAAPKLRVLLVDDDAEVRDVTASMLREMGCRVTEAPGGAAALEVLRDAPSGFDLLVADFAMPGMNGVELARRAALVAPTLRRLFVTGYADLGALRGVSEEQVLLKPFDAGQLAQRLQVVVERVA